MTEDEPIEFSPVAADGMGPAVDTGLQKPSSSLAAESLLGVTRDRQSLNRGYQ